MSSGLVPLVDFLSTVSSVAGVIDEQMSSFSICPQVYFLPWETQKVRERQVVTCTTVYVFKASLVSHQNFVPFMLSSIKYSMNLRHVR